MPLYKLSLDLPAVLLLIKYLIFHDLFIVYTYVRSYVHMYVIISRLFFVNRLMLI